MSWWTQLKLPCFQSITQIHFQNQAIRTMITTMVGHHQSTWPVVGHKRKANPQQATETERGRSPDPHILDTGACARIRLGRSR